jgi:L-seryl-tRNA(Ser) seleniumtransferase
MTSEQAKIGCDPGSLYRLLPSLNDLLLSPAFLALLQLHSHSEVTSSSRAVLARLKREIAEGQHTPASLTSVLGSFDLAVADELDRRTRYSLCRVINATGVILHTNLGRAPLSAAAVKHVAETAAGYCNLEFDLESGERSSRDVHAEELLLRLLRSNGGKGEGGKGEENLLLEARGAIIVNNCAAATFLALNSLAEGAEVVVSRGELVEIGGGFRIPEILAKSGARLREVGTTNRTRLSDYEAAISPDTGLILRVHQSNFSIEGFTERPTLGELVSLGRRKKVPVFDDQGTGLLFSLEDLGVRAEPTLVNSFHAGSDLIAASGDKLLGGPQCGLLVGRVELIKRIRKSPLFRALRVDKLTYAALEATLVDHLSGRANAIPVTKMLYTSPEEIRVRCQWIARQVNCGALSVDVTPVLSLIGGGTAPAARLPSSAVSLRHTRLQAQALLLAMRRLEPPVIGRVSDDRVLLDLRTVDATFDATLVSMLQQVAQIDGISHLPVEQVNDTD